MRSVILYLYIIAPTIRDETRRVRTWKRVQRDPRACIVYLSLYKISGLPFNIRTKCVVQFTITGIQVQRTACTQNRGIYSTQCICVDKQHSMTLKNSVHERKPTFKSRLEKLGLKYVTRSIILCRAHENPRRLDPSKPYSIKGV